MEEIIKVKNLCKTYASGQQALKNVNLSIRKGEILALLGANGAGKTTTISIICGIVQASSGEVLVKGHDIVRNYRQARSIVGVVPQELVLPPFAFVYDSVRLSRSLAGKKSDPAYLESLLKDLSLWEKRKAEIRTLSGGMKRRVLIAKALSYQPEIIFLDEPTAGVDVELRKGMWNTVRKLCDEKGVTIILTTHYIEEAQEMADRVGIMRSGELILLEEKNKLMQRFGQQRVCFELEQPLTALPDQLLAFSARLSEDGRKVYFDYQSGNSANELNSILSALSSAGLPIKHLGSSEKSLEDIFVELTSDTAQTQQINQHLT